MEKLIEKHIKKEKLKDKQQCIETLLNAGLRITDANKLEFTESHDFTTYSGKNKCKLFKPLMKGKVCIDTVNNAIKWYLNIEGLLIKFALTFITLTLFWQYFIQGIWINSILIGGVTGIIVFGINWLILNDKIDRLTRDMTIK